jgi:four helix bundle protein
MCAFSVRVMKLVDSLPSRRSAVELGKQLLRSGTSVSAKYRAARRGRSRAEFIAKLGIVKEEADETIHWIEMLVQGGHISPGSVQKLLQEADELLRIVVVSIKTARRNK